MTLWPKNVTSLTWGAKWPFRCLDEEYDACCYSYGKLSNLTRWLTLQHCRLICQTFPRLPAGKNWGEHLSLIFQLASFVSYLCCSDFVIIADIGQAIRTCRKANLSINQSVPSLRLQSASLSLSELSQFAASKNFPFSLAAKIPIFNSLGKPGVDLRNFGDLSTIAAELHFSTLGVWNFAPLLRQHPLCQPNISFTLNILQSVLFSLLNRKASVIHWYISMWRATV